MENQKTIKNEIEVHGVGLNTGKKVKLKFKPSPPNSGINFVRVDLFNKPIIMFFFASFFFYGSLRGSLKVRLHEIVQVAVVNYNLIIEVFGDQVKLFFARVILDTRDLY